MQAIPRAASENDPGGPLTLLGLLAGLLGLLGHTALIVYTVHQTHVGARTFAIPRRATISERIRRSSDRTSTTRALPIVGDDPAPIAAGYRRVTA